MPWLTMLTEIPLPAPHKCVFPKKGLNDDAYHETTSEYASFSWGAVVAAGSIWQCPGCPRRYKLVKDRRWFFGWFYEYRWEETDD